MASTADYEGTHTPLTAASSGSGELQSVWRPGSESPCAPARNFQILEFAYLGQAWPSDSTPTRCPS